MPCPNHDHSRAALATNHALPTNQHDRVYQHRQAWPSEEKVALAIEYWKAQDAANGSRCSSKQGKSRDLPSPK